MKAQYFRPMLLNISSLGIIRISWIFLQYCPYRINSCCFPIIGVVTGCRFKLEKQNPGNNWAGAVNSSYINTRQRTFFLVIICALYAQIMTEKKVRFWLLNGCHIPASFSCGAIHLYAILAPGLCHATTN